MNDQLKQALIQRFRTFEPEMLKKANALEGFVSPFLKFPFIAEGSIIDFAVYRTSSREFIALEVPVETEGGWVVTETIWLHEKEISERLYVQFSSLPSVSQLDHALLTRGKSELVTAMVQRGTEPEEYIRQETLNFIIDFMKQRAIGTIVESPGAPGKAFAACPQSEAITAAVRLEINGEILTGGRFLQSLLYSQKLLSPIRSNPKKAIPILERMLLVAIDNAILETANIMHKDPL